MGFAFLLHSASGGATPSRSATAVYFYRLYWKWPFHLRSVRSLAYANLTKCWFQSRNNTHITRYRALLNAPFVQGTAPKCSKYSFRSMLKERLD